MAEANFSTAQPELIQIGSLKKKASLNERLSAGPLAGHFFALGAVAGFVGMAGYGVHLWFMLAGQMPVSARYPHMKHLHAIIQFYLFFAPFILGFACQAGPKMLGGAKRAPFWLTLAIVPLVLGSILLSTDTYVLLARSLVSLAFCPALIWLLKLTRSEGVKVSHAFFFIYLSLLGLCAGAWIDFRDPRSAITVFLIGISPALIGAGQHFAASFLGAERPKETLGIVARSIMVLASLCLLLSHLLQIPVLWNLGIWASALSFFAILVGTKAYKAARPKPPIGIAFMFGLVWASLGFIQLIVSGYPASDSTVHMWATGWGVPMIIAVSCQVLAHLSGQPLLKPKIIIAFLLMWQTVPIGRGLLVNFQQLAVYSWVVSFVATIVIGIWAFTVIKAEVRIVKKQMSLARGERLGSC